MLVSMIFVKPLPRKRCEAGLTNIIDASKIFKAEISDSTGGFLSPDSRDTEARIFSSDISFCRCPKDAFMAFAVTGDIQTDVFLG